MKKTRFSERVRTLLFGVAAFFSVGAGTLRADDFAVESVSAKACAELPGNEGFVRGNGKTVFWKRYKAQDRIYLFSESEDEAAPPFPRCFDENFRKKRFRPKIIRFSLDWFLFRSTEN